MRTPPPVSMADIKLACKQADQDKQQMLALTNQGDIKTAGKPGWGSSFWNVSVPDNVTAMVNQYNQYLLRHAELTERAPKKQLTERSVEPILYGSDCQVQRFEKDIGELEQSPAFKLHEAEVALERYFANKASNQPHQALEPLVKEVMHLAFDLFEPDFLSQGSYFDEVLAKLAEHLNENTLEDLGLVGHKFANFQLGSSERGLIDYFLQTPIKSQDQQEIQKIAKSCLKAAKQSPVEPEQLVQRYIEIIGKLYELANDDQNIIDNVRVVDFVLMELVESTTPVNTTPTRVSLSDDENDEDYQTPQSSLNQGPVPQSPVPRLEDNDPVHEAEDIVFNDNDQDLAPGQSLLTSLSFREIQLSSGSSSDDEYDDQPPLTLQDLARERLDVQQSLRPFINNPHYALEVEEPAEPELMDSILSSLSHDKAREGLYSIDPGQSLLQPDFPGAATELESVINDERLFEDLSPVEAIELEKVLQDGHFQAEFHHTINLSNEPGSPGKPSDLDSLPPAPRTRLASQVPPRNTARVIDEQDQALTEWHFANPLSPRDQATAQQEWRRCFSELYEKGRLEQLPDYEQRMLETQLYQACLGKTVRPSKAELMDVLRQHKSFVEKQLPISCAFLHRKADNPRPLFDTEFRKEVSGLMTSPPASPITSRAINEAVNLMLQCAATLSNSPYDDTPPLWERKDHLLHLQQSLEDPAFFSGIAASEQDENQQIKGLLDSLNQDKATLLEAIKEDIQVTDLLVANDFRQEQNLLIGLNRLQDAAIFTVKEEIENLKALHSPLFQIARKPLKTKKKKLLKLLGKLESQKAELSRVTPSNKLVPNLVKQLHDHKKELTRKMTKKGITSEAINKGLELTLNSQPWVPISKKLVIHHNGQYHTYPVENLPAGALHWSKNKGLHTETGDNAHNVDLFGLGHGGRSSMSTTEKDHAVNAWLVKVSGEDGQGIMSKVRSGVPVPFPKIGVLNDEEVEEITINRLKDTIALMLLARKAGTTEFQAALDNPGKTLDFAPVHNSLLSPDQVRKAFNALAEKFPEDSPVRKKIKKMLDNEAAMLGFIERAMETLSDGSTPIHFKDDTGQSHTVQIKYDGILFCCPINKMGESKAYNLWGAVDRINDKSSSKMFGSNKIEPKLGGRVGAFIDNPATSQGEKILAEKLARQVQYILVHKLHHNNREMCRTLASLLNSLSELVADGYHDFCKSGKDRTGLENQHAILKRAQIHASGGADLPPLDAPQSQDERFSNQSALACSGQDEIVQQNIAEAGMKIDQGPKLAGEQLYYAIHY